MLFFEVSAQLIPLLFIALVFERQYFDRSDGNHEVGVGLSDIWVILLFIFGEAVCLQVIATEEIKDSSHEFVILALLVATLLLVHPLLLGGVRSEWRSESRGSWRWLNRAAAVFAVGGAYLTLGALFVLTLISLLIAEYG